MPSPASVREAETLQYELRTLLGHDKVGVRPYGQHLLIHMQDADHDTHTVARLTNLGLKHYGAAFRTHTGRWEPLPGDGTLTEMAELVTEMLAPYLNQDNY